MSSYDDRELRSLLTPNDRPMPPSDLAARIKAEIPADLAFAPQEDVVAERASEPVWRRRGWLIAASLVTILGGAWLAERTMTEMPTADRTKARVGADATPRTEPGRRAASPSVPSAAPELPAPELPTEPVPPLAMAEGHGKSTIEQPTSRSPIIEPPSTEPLSTEPPINEPQDGATGAREREQATALGSEVLPPAQRALMSRGSTPVPGPATESPVVADSPVAAESSIDEAQVSAWSSSAGDASSRSGQALATPPPARVATARQRGVAERAKRAAPSRDDRSRGAAAFQSRSEFPLAVDTESYALVRRLVEEGVWPPPEMVRVHAMVNRFDYGDAPPPPGEDFALHAEGSSMPPGGEGARRIMLRLGVRTRAFFDDPGRRDGGAVAMAARAWLSFNPAVVAQYRLLGGDDRRDANKGHAAVATGAIHVGHMATALYEIELVPHVDIGPGWRDDVAMLHLDWKNAATGANVTRSRRITGDDVADDWGEASATLRWSVLVARLAEALQRGESGAALAALREETERLSPLLFHHPGFVEFRALVESVDRLPR